MRREKIPIASVYAKRKGIKKPSKKNPVSEYLWHEEFIRKILKNQAYVGDVVNFKTYTKSFKLKTQLKNPKENWEIHKNVHEPIIERTAWETI